MKAPKPGMYVLALLGALIVCNTVLVVRVELQARALRAANPWQRLLGRRELPAPSGYGPGGDRVGSSAAAGARCWSVRYSTPACGFCHTDAHGAWAQLARKLKHLGCGSFVAPPTQQEAFGKIQTVPAGAKRIEFLSVAWLRAPLTALPTTLVFGPSGRLVWHRGGELAAGDPAAAMSALRAAMKTSGGGE